MKSIKTKFSIYLGTILTVACTVLGSVSFYFSSNSFNDQIQQVLMEKAKDVSQIVSSRIEGHQKAINTVANRNVFRQNQSWDTQLQALKDESDRLGFMRMGISNSDGDYRYSNGLSVNYADMDFFKVAMAGKQYISDPFISRIDNKIVIVYSEPVKDMNGNIIGVLNGVIDGNHFSEILKDIVFGEKGYPYMTNKDGIIIGHINEELVQQQYNLLEDAKTNPSHQALADLIVKAINGETGYGKYHFKGADKTMGFAPVKGTQWSVSVTGENDEIFAGLNKLKLYIPFISVFIISLAIIVIFFIVRRMVAGLIQSKDHLMLIAHGDLTKDVSRERLEMKDEIGELSKGINDMQDSMRSVIKDIITSSNELSVSSNTLLQAVQNSSANMQEISASTEEMSAGMETISASTQEITASSQEMVNSLIELGARSNEGNITAKEVENRADILNRKANSARKAAMDIAQNIQEKVIAAIDKAKVVEQISQLTTTISGIASQTNLLALNAAIEAARAGEQGRGFAVVAEEVRKLAEESSFTVTNIQQLTKEVQESLNELVGSSKQLMDFISQEVKADYDSFVEVGEQYKHDADSFNKLASETNLRCSSIVQSVREVQQSLENIAVIINQSTNGAQQIAEGTGHTSKTLEEVSNASERLQEMAQHMKNKVNKFRVS